MAFRRERDGDYALELMTVINAERRRECAFPPPAPRRRRHPIAPTQPGSASASAEQREEDYWFKFFARGFCHNRRKPIWRHLANVNRCDTRVPEATRS